MTRLTTDQIEFAKSMSIKQRRVLRMKPPVAIKSGLGAERLAREDAHK